MKTNTFKKALKSILAFWKKFYKWIISGTLSALIISQITLNWISALGFEFVFPGYEKKMEQQIQKMLVNQEMGFKKSQEIYNLLSELQINPREIQQFLKELPLAKGKEVTLHEIEKWVTSNKISTQENELLQIIISTFFEQSKILNQTILEQKQFGETYITKFLENIQKYMDEAEGEKIKMEYFSLKEKRKKEEISLLKQAIQSTQSLNDLESTRTLLIELVAIEPNEINYHNLGIYSQLLNYFEEAIENYDKAASIYITLAKENSNLYLPILFEVYNNLSVSYFEIKNFEVSIKKYNETLEINKLLVKRDSVQFLPGMASTLKNMGILNLNLMNYALAKEQFEEAIAIREKLAKNDFVTNAQPLAGIHMELGTYYSEINNLQAANAEFEKSFQLYTELSAIGQGANANQIVSLFNNRGVLYDKMKQYEKAGEMFSATLEIYRNLAKTNPKRHLINVASTLSNWAHSQHKVNFEFAFELYSESISIYKTGGRKP